MELLPQSLEAAPVAGTQAELGDVEAGGMGHVDHEGIGQDQQLVLLGTQQQPLPSELGGTKVALPSHEPPTPSASAVPGAPHPPVHPAP